MAGRKVVLMFAGGGVAHTSGGVGTLIRYLQDEWANEPDAPPVRVIDTRGQGGMDSMVHSFLKGLCLLLYLGSTGRIGIVHAHMTTRGSAVRKSILGLLANLLGIPVIMHLHGADFREFYDGLPRPFRKGIRFALNHARFVVVLGGGWREFLVSDMGIAPDKIAVILNGVPLPVDKDKVEKQPDEAIRIAFLGRLGERKGVPELLEALRSPGLTARSWTATIAGDGPVEKFRQVVGKTGLQDRVTLPGWLDRDATSDLLRRADIFVLPSHHEAMPIAILEAMAHGLAVIATPVGVIPEFLTNGETALLVPPGIPGRLAEAIARLIDDADERQRLGAAGHAVFRASLDISVVASRILALYQAAMRIDHAETKVPRRTALERPYGLEAARAVIDKIEIIDTDAEEASLIARMLRTDRPLVVSFVNQHVLNIAWKSPEFAERLIRSDVLLRDGIGMEICLSTLRRGVGRNMNGTDFIPRLAAAFSGRRTAIYGTVEPWIDRAASVLEQWGCRIVSTLDGFRQEAEYVSDAMRTAPELIVLAMGNPKQEAVADAIAASTQQPVVIVTGGAIADFLAQRFERAPAWMRRAHCEWVYRLLREPRRLWRRYLIGGFTFVSHVLWLRLAPR
ncbi:MAG: WecB/TagA/CpsF family glycosyltransferase [Rhodopila sp.]|nr:WecB/TagA/CpsF family glycosyltransferase [Rhodopila sp.]